MTILEDSARLPRLDALTGLRWWAAFAVFAHHMVNLTAMPAAFAALAAFGHLGVTFFFVLSGFVLTWSWRPEVDKRTFYWRRFARIYPLTVVTLILAIPVFYSFSPDPAQPWVKPFDVGILILCLLLLQGWSRDPTILFAGNPAAWTLTVEAFFYAMHPFVTLGLKRLALRGALIAAGGVVVFAFTARVLITTGAIPGLGALPWPILRFPEFVLGMCLAWAMRKGWRPRLHPIVPTALIGLWLVALVLLRRYPESAGVYGAVGPYNNEIITVLCALLIISAASADLRGRSRFMRARPFVLLGEWSYAFYLIHATIIYAALEIFGYQGDVWASLVWFVVLLALSIAAAWALHVFIERPVEKALRTWQNRRRLARLTEREVTAAT